MVLSDANALLIGVLAQTWGLGIYFVLLPASIHFLREHRKSLGRSARTHNTVLHLAAILLCCLIVANWALSIDDVRRIFMVAYPDPTIIFGTYRTVQGLLLVTETAVLDAILLYRVYTIWARSVWVVILPALCLVGSLVTGVVTVLARDRLIISSQGYRLWLSLSLATNGLAVALIAYRIFSDNQRHTVRPVDETRFSFVAMVIMESAFVYCACNLAALIAQVMGSTVMWLFLDVMSVATGIAFSLLLIRVREERRSRLIRRMSEGVGTPPPHRSHAVELSFKPSDLA